MKTSNFISFLFIQIFFLITFVLFLIIFLCLLFLYVDYITLLYCCNYPLGNYFD